MAMSAALPRPLYAHARDPFSGYSHLVGLGLAVVGGAWLAATASHGASLLAVLVYAACMVALYAASSAYHLVDLGEKVTARLRRFDHAAIFLMIAGTSTPLFVHALTGGARTLMLAAVWGVATVGILFRTFWIGAPRWFYVATYLAAGWIVVLQWKAVVAGLPALSFHLLLAGGVVYSLGAVVYALKWPDPLPKRFGFHEIWHLFVMAASALHFAAILVVA
jgi:hemolysin III